MSLWDKAKQLLGQTPQHGTLNTVSEQDHANAIIKERADLCSSLTAEPEEQTVTRDNGRDIIFLGWQICNVEERHVKAIAAWPTSSCSRPGPTSTSANA